MRQLVATSLLVVLALGMIVLAAPRAEAAQPAGILCRLDDGSIRELGSKGGKYTMGELAKICRVNLGGHPAGVIKG